MTNYNVLFHALLYMSATDDYQLQRKVAQCNTQTGAASGTCQRIRTDNAGGNAATTTRQHVIDSWLGFLGSAKPNFIDTSLIERSIDA